MSSKRPINVEKLSSTENRRRTRKSSMRLRWSPYEHAIVDFGEWTAVSCVYTPEHELHSERRTKQIRKVDRLFVDALRFIQKAPRSLIGRGMNAKQTDIMCRLWRVHALVRGQKIKEEKSEWKDEISQ